MKFHYFIILYSSGFVELHKVKDYVTGRDKYIKLGRGVVFNDAVQKMDEYISNPLVSQNRNDFVCGISKCKKLLSHFISF